MESWEENWLKCLTMENHKFWRIKRALKEWQDSTSHGMKLKCKEKFSDVNNALMKWFWEERKNKLHLFTELWQGLEIKL